MPASDNAAALHPANCEKSSLKLLSLCQFLYMGYRRCVIAASAAALVLAALTASFSRSFENTMRAVRAANALANFSGRRAVVVGGTSGIGEGVAKRLAEASFDVTIVGRSAERGHAIVAELQTIGPGARHEFIACDAQLLANAKSCADAFRSKHDSLDVLVLSQGIGTFQGRTVR